MDTNEPAVAVGYDIGGTKIAIAAIGADNTQPLYTHCVPTPKTYDAFLDSMDGLFSRVKREQSGLDKKSIGIGMPGILDRENGLVLASNHLPWTMGKPLREDLQRVLGSDVIIENDANCFALAEAKFGAGVGYNFVMGVILGTGLGGGMVINGRLHVGPHAFAGEYGSNPLPWRAPVTPALEFPGSPDNDGSTILNGQGLVNLYRAFGGEGNGDLTPVTVMHRYKAEDPAARQAFNYFVDALARLVAHKVNDTDPDVFVFGGGLAHIDKLYELLPAKVSGYLMPIMGQPTELKTPLKRAQLIDTAGSIGAALLTRQNFRNGR